MTVESIAIRIDEKFELVPFKGIAQGDSETFRIEWFDEEIEGAVAHGIDGDIDGSMCGYDNHFRRDAVLVNMTEDVHTLNVREIQIEQNHLRKLVFDEL